MLNPIQANTQSTAIPADAFSGQRTEPNQVTPLQVVDRKQDIPTAREEIPREQVEKAMDKLNRLMGLFNKRMEVSVNNKAHCITVKIIDQASGEVLDEIPSQQALDLMSSFTDTVGLRVNKQV